MGPCVQKLIVEILMLPEFAEKQLLHHLQFDTVPFRRCPDPPPESLGLRWKTRVHDIMIRALIPTHICFYGLIALFNCRIRYISASYLTFVKVAQETLSTEESQTILKLL